MQVMSATDVRKEWSFVVDSVVRDKPAFIKRTRDSLVLTDTGTLEAMLENCKFTASSYIEKDGSTTLSLDQLDIVENGVNEEAATKNMAEAILDYSEDYYNDFSYWSRGERKKHIPYVFKALLLGNPEKIGGIIKCHPGKN